MSLVHNILFSLVRRAATNPKVQSKAGEVAAKVDQKMTKAADNVAEIVTAKDPTREAGKRLGRLLSGQDAKKD